MVQEKPELIMAQAEQLFIAHGFHGTSMQMIAKAAGIAAGTLYLHFPGKEMLIRTIYRRALTDMLRCLMLDYDPAQPPFGQYRRFWLNAYHESGSIVIEVADDGGGLRKDKILAKAVSNGLISADAVLSDSDIYKLIFEPGFSTADAVSNLSGRGVGMDVVRRNIEALRGTVDISSEPGYGTQFQLRLPLTLAIIDGFMVRVGQSRFVIPLDMVNECIELPVGQDQATAGAGYLNLRGEVLPFIHLHQLFGLGSTASDRRSIVVVRYGKQSAGLVVDQLLGEFQTVIKPLGKLFQFLQGISGSSILGSGDIALILDIPRLVQIHVQATERQRTTMVI